MSMLASLRRISAAELEALITDPHDIFWYLHGSEPYEPPPGFLKRLFKRTPPVPARPEPWTAPPETHQLDLDQSWHCLHYLLCGEPWESNFPAGFLFSGGTQLGDVDVGYGPARGYGSNEVSLIADFLVTLSQTDVQNRCDPSAMADAEIYGAVESPDDFPFLWESLVELRTFVCNAAASGEGIIIFVY